LSPGEERENSFSLWERVACASNPGEGDQKPLIPQPLLPKEKGSNIGGSDKSAENIQKSFSLWEKVPSEARRMRGILKERHRCPIKPLWAVP